MKDIPTEVMYVLMFVVVMLLQYLMKRFGPPEQTEALPQEGLPQQPAAVEEAPLTPAASTIAVGHFGRTEVPVIAPEAPPARVQGRFGRAALMGTRREVQNAIVIAAILGPCRAFEPHDVR